MTFDEFQLQLNDTGSSSVFPEKNARILWKAVNTIDHHRLALSVSGVLKDAVEIEVKTNSILSKYVTVTCSVKNNIAVIQTGHDMWQPLEGEAFWRTALIETLNLVA